MSERDTQAAIIDYLRAKRIFHYRNNTGAYKAEHGSFVRFGTVGSPDIICVINGQFIGIEVKSLKGKQNPDQIQFQKSVEKAGGRYILARSVDDIIATL